MFHLLVNLLVLIIIAVTIMIIIIKIITIIIVKVGYKKQHKYFQHFCYSFCNLNSIVLVLSFFIEN